MKVLIAPDSFKGSLSAAEAARSIARGVQAALPDAQIRELPLADGGEGTLDCVLEAERGIKLPLQVTGPLGEEVIAQLGLIDGGRTALVELAQAAGLMLVPREKRNPRKTTSFGVGELILAALDQGAGKILITLGGSSVNDAGTGALAALGARFLGADDRPIALGGYALSELARVDLSGLDARLQQCALVIASDVDNPLSGDQGASIVYGPQKGASAEDARALDGALKHFAGVVAGAYGRDISAIPGCGAAGGFAASFLAFTRARLCRGFDLVADAVGLDSAMEGVDLILTGEGCIDRQTLRGKVPVALAARAGARGIEVAAFCGALGPGWEALNDKGIKAVIPLVAGTITEEEALRNAAALLEDAARSYALQRKPI